MQLETYHDIGLGEINRECVYLFSAIPMRCSGVSTWFVWQSAHGNALMQNLTFGWRFNQNLDNVTFPAGLQSLTFEFRFNQHLEACVLSCL